MADCLRYSMSGFLQMSSPCTNMVWIFGGRVTSIEHFFRFIFLTSFPRDNILAMWSIKVDLCRVWDVWWCHGYTMSTGKPGLFKVSDLRQDNKSPFLLKVVVQKCDLIAVTGHPCPGRLHCSKCMSIQTLCVCGGGEGLQVFTLELSVSLPVAKASSSSGFSLHV